MMKEKKTIPGICTQKTKKVFWCLAKSYGTTFKSGKKEKTLTPGFEPGTPYGTRSLKSGNEIPKDIPVLHLKIVCAVPDCATSAI